MRIINPFTALVFGVLATVGESLKTLVIVNFPKEEEMINFKKAVYTDSIASRDDVILIENPINLQDLQTQLVPHRGTFDRAVFQVHGNFNERVPLMLLTSDNAPYEIGAAIAAINEGNEKTLKKIHLSSCHIGKYFEKIKEHETSSYYYQDLQESLHDDQFLFLHGDGEVGVVLGDRLKGIVEEEDYSIHQALIDSGNPILVVTKRRGNPQLETFSPGIFGRRGEKFSSQEALTYLYKVSKAVAEFEAKYGLVPHYPANLSDDELSKFLDRRFRNDAMKFLHINDLNSIRLMLDNGANPESLSGGVTGETLLFSIFDKEYSHRYIPLLDLLIEKGADINRQRIDGVSALMHASSSGRADIVIALLDRGANIDQQNPAGHSALMHASSSGRADIVTALLNRGAKTDLLDKDDRSALMYASSSGRTDIVTALLNIGAKIDLSDKYGRSALMCAAKKGHVDVVKVLLAKGANANLEDEDGKSASSLASDSGHKEIVDLLAQREAGTTNINLKTKDGKLASSIASDSGNKESVDLLAQSEAGTTNNGNIIAAALATAAIVAGGAMAFTKRAPLHEGEKDDLEGKKDDKARAEAGTKVTDAEGAPLSRGKKKGKGGKR